MILNKLSFYLLLLNLSFNSLVFAEDSVNKDLIDTNQAPIQGEVFKIPLTTNDGKQTTLKQFEGKVIIISNTASECGFTYQYKDLQSLYTSYRDKGLVVLGFPSNDFGGQEPGSDTEIKSFCVKNYGVSFPLFKKDSVSGENIQPLFKTLLESAPNEIKGPVEWNFEKIILDKKGNVRGRFGSFVNPLNHKITSLIDKLLEE